jgi:hypothetical protein
MKETIQDRFEEFDREHPEVYRFLLEKSRLALSKGRKQFSIKSLWESARWFFEFEHDSEEEFKLNNNYHSRYARKLMAENPDLAGFFETRQLLTQ